MKATIEKLPQSGRVEIAIKVAADINISAQAARQKVNDFVLSEISYMMHASDPEFVVSDRIAWRIPIALSLTSHGDVGEVGVATVDVETGQMVITPEIEEIYARADDLARRSPSPAAA